MLLFEFLAFFAAKFVQIPPPMNANSRESKPVVVGSFSATPKFTKG